MNPNKEVFHKALLELLSEANSQGQDRMQVAARELHRRVGGYPGKNHRMPMCCDAMYDFMRRGDTIVAAPPKRKGASLVIEYAVSRS